MAMRTDESRTDSLTDGFVAAFLQELFEEISVCRVGGAYFFLGCADDGHDLFAATPWFGSLLMIGSLQSGTQNEAAYGAMFAGGCFGEEAMLLRRGSYA
jgi:hypothetical protein